MQTDKDYDQRILIVAYLIAALFFILAIRFWQLQILQGKEYRRLSEENRLRIVRVAAPRGIIYDRNGVSLVKNSQNYSVSVAPDSIGNLDILMLSELLDINADRLYEKIKLQRRTIYESIKLKEGLSLKEIALIEARKSDFPGLTIEVDVSREYLYGSSGAHLVGYLGKLNQSQSRHTEFKDLPPDAFIGQWGIEKLYDKHLRGIPGEKIIEIDALGKELRLLQEISPVKGEDLKLAIDINLQKEAEEAFGERTGALVAIKTDSGEILALVSKPSFDPNMFTNGINQKQWEGLVKNPGQPLLNRALQSQYPPGSTFKIITAIAGLETGVIDSNTQVTCNGGIAYGKWRFGCWQKHGHGTVSLHRALVESCDVYFYEVGRRLGIDQLASYARAFGLGTESGLPLVRERTGLIPDTKWKLEKRKQQWYLGETLNASIGQGYVATTPFQMANLISSVANGGNIYKPSLLILNNIPEPIKKLDIKQSNIDKVKSALLGVVNERGGTGSLASSQLTDISGKTGTSQVIGLRKSSKYLPEKHRDHAWFVSFAPYEKPDIAVSVMVEHGGHGGSAAAPIAKRAIEAYLKSSQKHLVNAKKKEPDLKKEKPTTGLTEDAD